VADLLRRSRRLRGQPPEEVPSHYEGLKVLISPGGSKVGSPEEGESSWVVHPDYQGLETGYNPKAIAVSELTGSFSSTGDIGEEPEISEPVTPTSSVPDSPRVERVITENLPSGLIAIEELASPKEEEGLSIPENQPIIKLRERESIFYSPPRSTTWYLSLTNYLDNSGLSFSPSRAPYPPGGIYTPVNMSGQSSTFTQSPESFVYGGPSVPSGYQSLSGTFVGASPQPIEHGLLTGNNGNRLLGAGDIYMMLGSTPSSQPQGGQLPPGGQPQGLQVMTGGQPQGTQFVSGGQPQGQYIPTGQYIPQGQPQAQYVPQGQSQYPYVPQGQPQYQYIPQGYQPQGYQPPSGQSFVQGTGNVPLNYQPYPQPGYGPQYGQPTMSPYPGMTLVWNQPQPVLQVQSSSSTGQPLVSGPNQQPVQSTIQTSAPSMVSQLGPSTPRTPPQTAAATIAISTPSTTLTSGVSTAPVSTTPTSIPQASLPQSRPTIQTTVQIPVG